MPIRDPQQEHIQGAGPGFLPLMMGIVGVAAFIALASVTRQIGPAAIPIWAFVIGGAAYVLRGPLGQAMAQRLTGGTNNTTVEVPNEVYAELDDLRARVGELEERVDFSERLLTQEKRPEA